MTLFMALLLSMTPMGPDENPQDAFWKALNAMCGMNFKGEITININPSSADFEGLPRAEFRKCEENRIEIAFHIGTDRSRTWILTRSPQGIRLKHDHRHEDGTPHRVTNYGGDTKNSGQADRQEFYVDDYTIRLVAGTSKNIWVMDVKPGHIFGYELYKGDQTPVFRVEFDLRRPIR